MFEPVDKKKLELERKKPLSAHTLRSIREHLSKAYKTSTPGFTEKKMF